MKLQLSTQSLSFGRLNQRLANLTNKTCNFKLLDKISNAAIITNVKITPAKMNGIILGAFS